MLSQSRGTSSPNDSSHNDIDLMLTQTQVLEQAQRRAIAEGITDDHLEGQDFLSRHRDSRIIQTARSIVGNKFSAINHSGWRRVLESCDFYPGHNRGQKEDLLDGARRRLIRWFDVSGADSKAEIL